MDERILVAGDYHDVPSVDDLRAQEGLSRRGPGDERRGGMAAAVTDSLAWPLARVEPTGPGLDGCSETPVMASSLA